MNASVILALHLSVVGSGIPAGRKARKPGSMDQVGVAGPGSCPRRGPVGMTVASQAPRDQQLHDLVGAGIDALDARVAVHARDRVLVHIAIAAEQLQASV